VVLLIGAVVALATNFFRAIHAASTNQEEVAFEIQKGEGVRVVAGRLRDAGLLDWPRWFALQAHWKGVAGKLKFGEYLIPPHTSVDRLIALFVSGKVRKHSFTIVEGWNAEQVLLKLSEHPALVHRTEPLSRLPLLAEVGLSGSHPEGRFLPDTYVFPKGYSELDLLRKAREKMDLALESEWQKRQPGLPYARPYDALIMASIVEKETAIDAERPLVAGVFVRRLLRGMRLQADPTVIYGMGKDYRGDITRDALRRDTPYNTYTRSGLPPTPIAMPGLASLHAALNPDQSDNVYFVAAGDGSHVFTSNLADHERAVSSFLRKRRE
jgi:UPF0755 protein